MSIDTTAIKANTDLRAMVESDLGPPAKRAGRVSHWRCPFHEDGTTPSLAVYDDGGYKCFGCGASGDVITWRKQYHKEDFQAACKVLAGGDLPATDGLPSKRPRSAVKLAEPPPALWQHSAAMFAIACHKALTAPQVDWLTEHRGLTSETIGDKLIGINSRDHKATWRGKEVWLPRGYVIPHWQQSTDTIWGLKVWRGYKADPKYIFVTGSKANMFGVDSLAGKDTVIVTEGEFDCLLLSQFVGDRGATVTFGGASTHEIDGWLPYLLPVKRLLICTDNDEAGEQAWQYWHSKTARAVRLLPPGGCKDITDSWKAGHDLAAWVEEATR